MGFLDVPLRGCHRAARAQGRAGGEASFLLGQQFGFRLSTPISRAIDKICGVFDRCATSLHEVVDFKLFGKTILGVHRKVQACLALPRSK